MYCVKNGPAEFRYWLRYTWNVNKIDIVVHFSKLICQFLLICYQVHMSEISTKSDEFLLNYGKLFPVHFLLGHSVNASDNTVLKY